MLSRETLVTKENAADVYLCFLDMFQHHASSYNQPKPKSSKPFSIEYDWAFKKRSEACDLMDKEFIKHQDNRLIYFYYLDNKGSRVGGCMVEKNKGQLENAAE